MLVYVTQHNSTCEATEKPTACQQCRQLGSCVCRWQVNCSGAASGAHLMDKPLVWQANLAYNADAAQQWAAKQLGGRRTSAMVQSGRRRCSY